MARSMFHYKDLSAGKIRLLKTIGGHSFRVQYEVEHFDRKDAPPYVALSYTWGQGTATERILLDNHYYKVRPNLWQALYEMGRFGEWRYLWVDAICINQANTHERNHQVESMDGTYRNATTVVVWLGPTCEVDRREDWNWREHLAELANRSYWSRMWIVQELVLAQHVQILCGRHRISWAEFTAALKSGGSSTTQQRTVNESAAKKFLDVKARPESRHLASLLRVYCHSGCEDRRDRVFALLSLLPSVERDYLLRYFPNYELDADSVLLIMLKMLRSGTNGILDDADLKQDDEIATAFGLDKSAWASFLRVSAEDKPLFHLRRDNLDGTYEVIAKPMYNWSALGLTNE